LESEDGTEAQKVNGRGGVGSIRAADLGLKPKKHILEKEKARRAALEMPGDGS
jgi:hypothetical protein